MSQEEPPEVGKDKSGDGRKPATELVLAAILVIDKLADLFSQTGRG